jgi:hypothetical protein
MPETTDLIERLNKRAENGRVFHTDRKLFAEAATALSENIETINGQAMGLATLRARLASCEAEREKAIELIDEGLGILVSLIDNVTRHGNYSPESTCTFIDQAGGSFRAARAALTKGGEDA